MKITERIKSLISRIKAALAKVLHGKVAANPQAQMINYRRNAILRTVIVAAIILFGVLLAKNVVERWNYSSYQVISEKAEEDVSSAQYAKMGGSLLKYNGDGAVLMNMQGKPRWSESYDVESPAVDVCQEAAVIYSRKGTHMVMMGMKGKLGSVEAEMPILKAKIASQGVVVAILEDGEDTWINYYSTKGEQIATAKTRVDSPGYPVDLAISPNGMLLMVTYLLVDNGMPKSYVAFYNFGNAGQNQMDNMVSGYTYSGVLVPQVNYLSKSLAVAFRDDGFTIYQGSQVPKESKTIAVKKEILSTFCSDKYIGLIFDSDSGNKQYTLQVYNIHGKLKFSKDFSMDYGDVKFDNDAVLMHNEANLNIFSMQGVEKYRGTLKENTILNVFKSGTNRYHLVTSSGFKTIKLR